MKELRVNFPWVKRKVVREALRTIQESWRVVSAVVLRAYCIPTPMGPPEVKAAMWLPLPAGLVI